MPFYDYYCELNRKTIEVYHPINMKLKSWGEVCQIAKINPGNTPKYAAVVRLINHVSPTVFRLKGLDKDQPSAKLQV